MSGNLQSGTSQWMIDQKVEPTDDDNCMNCGHPEWAHEYFELELEKAANGAIGSECTVINCECPYWR